MRATGIVRRIDDLGRVVIPKEIRRTLKIHEGDPLEIFTDGGAVVFKKYKPDDDIGTMTSDLSEVLEQMLESVQHSDENREEFMKAYSEVRGMVTKMKNLQAIFDKI